MRREKISEAMGAIDERYIEEASEKSELRRGRWKPWAALAACFGLVLTIGFLAADKIGIGDEASKSPLLEKPQYDAPSLPNNPQYVAPALPDEPQYCPQPESSFDFDTYEELDTALRDGTMYKQLAPDYESTPFQRFLKQFMEGKRSLLIPAQHGSPMNVGDPKAQWQKISLLRDELFGLPWIWYYCQFEGETVVVCVGYPEDMGVDMDEGLSYLDIQNQMSPDAPSPDNAENYPHYDAIYEQELALDGRTVTALVLDGGEGERVYYRFCYEDAIVNVWGYKETVPESFWKGFSLQLAGCE